MNRWPLTIVALLVLACVLLGRLVAAVPRSREPVVDRFHKLEFNHVYSPDDGNDRLVQLLGRDAGNVVHFWRMAKPGMKPRRDWKRGDYVSLWQDGDVLREIRAPHYDETWTPEDEEVLQREVVPVCQRRGLLPGKVKP